MMDQEIIIRNCSLQTSAFTSVFPSGYYKALFEVFNDNEEAIASFRVTATMMPPKKG